MKKQTNKQTIPDINESTCEFKVHAKLKQHVDTTPNPTLFSTLVTNGAMCGLPCSVPWTCQCSLSQGDAQLQQLQH